MHDATFPNASPGGPNGCASTEAKSITPLGDAPNVPAGQRTSAFSEAQRAAPAGATPSRGERPTYARLHRGPLTRALAPALLILLATLDMVRAEPIDPAALRVVDGDTVAVGKVHYRLVGFDTPELRGRAGRCDDGRALARAARGRLRVLIAAGGIDLTEVACSCRPGTEGTRDCNHGRRCGTLTTAGRDVGDILITEGLARPYPYDWRHPPKPANWCGR